MIASVICLLIFYQSFPQFIYSAESNISKLSDVFKNHTFSINNNHTNNRSNEDNLLKQETHKLLSECGVQHEDSYQNKRNTNNSKRNYATNKRKSSHKDHEYDSNEDSKSNSEYDAEYNDNHKRNRYRGRYSNNYEQRGNSNESDQENNNRKNYGSRRTNYNRDCKDDNRDYNSNNRNQWKPYDADNNNYENYYGSGYGYNGNSRRGFADPGSAKRFDESFRTRRSNNEQESDAQCISQCVFGYLEVLDDNRMPSETLVIKWLQDHLTDDMKRLRALREARRCFARLSTSDTEDGCAFSQALSKCLNLELQ